MQQLWPIWKVTGVSDDFQELQVGTLLALRFYRVPNYDLEGRKASFIKVFKIRNDVLNIEEVIVLWMHRSVVVRRVPHEDQPRGGGGGPGQDGGDEPRVRDPDPRRGLPRIAAMRAGQPDQSEVRGNTQQGNRAEQPAPQPSSFSWGGYEADGEHGEDDTSLPSSTLRAPGIEVSSSTPGPNSLTMTSSSSGVKPIEPSSGLGGHRVDSLNVPGGRVDSSLQWSIRFHPDEHSDDSVAVSSMPLLSLSEEERDRLRNRTMWLMDFVEEERAIQRQRIERGEYPTQERHQAFYRLDRAIDHLVEVMRRDGTPLDDVRLRAMRFESGEEETEELLWFVEVSEEELAEEGEARMMKATQETLHTPNIEDLLGTVSPENPLKVTHTVDPREVLPVVEKWVPAMKAELNSLEQMPAIKKHRGCEAAALRRDPQVVVVPSKLVFTVKPGVEPGSYRRKVRGVACGHPRGLAGSRIPSHFSPLAAGTTGTHRATSHSSILTRRSKTPSAPIWKRSTISRSFSRQPATSGIRTWSSSFAPPPRSPEGQLPLESRKTPAALPGPFRALVRPHRCAHVAQLQRQLALQRVHRDSSLSPPALRLLPRASTGLPQEPIVSGVPSDPQVRRRE